jgi:class 3 adenylate cyclase/tetratricopeptide (TPR) repeat protein
MDVGGWLRSLGLPQYEATFRASEIDGEVLRELTDGDLEKLGLPLGHRKRLLKAIAALDGQMALAHRPEPASKEGAERRQLTVMFCDLVGSTALSARLDLEDMREIIGAYQRCCAKDIAKAGGFVAKYMGDGVLAYFGYPQAHEDDAERAVRAGLALIDAVPRLRTAHGAALQVRIGIATGLVVVGDLIGQGAAQEQGVVGETPNVAARLQVLAEPGQLVISNSTRRLTGGMFEYHDLGMVTLKGLAVPVHALQVTGASAVQSRFEATHETGLTPLVGREEELELLLRRWRQAARGEGCVVLLAGEPGIGKSRLIVALEECDRSTQHGRLRYFCSPQHQDSALYPVIRHLERAAGFERHDTADIKLDKLIKLIEPSSDNQTDLRLLAEMMSIPTSDRYGALHLTPQGRKEKTFAALLRQLETQCRRQPVLLVYEDVHWIDPTSRELLDMTVERVAGLPVLLVISFRPEFLPPWTGQAQVTTLNLSRLSKRLGTALVDQVAASDRLSRDLVEEIVERTDGVPLFVEELTKAVLEAVDDGGAGTAVASAPPLRLKVPATLHASLMARLDRLGTAAKEAAQIGAAIGREFSYELCRMVADLTGAEVREALDRLMDAGLVFRRGVPPRATFLFKHALVQEVAYGSLLRQPRQALHGRIARSLEGHFPEIVEAQPEILAYHCTEAGFDEEAIAYLRKAGEQAVQGASNREAIEHFRRALSLNEARSDTVERSRMELAILSRLGPALMSVYGWRASEVGAAFERAREVARTIENSADLAPPLMGLWLFHASRGQLHKAVEISNELFNLARDLDDRDILLQAHHAAWPTRWVRGEFADAMAHIDAGLELYDEGRHSHHRFLYLGHDPAVCALSIGAVVKWVLGRPDQGIRLEREAVVLARRLQHTPSVAHGLWFVAEAQAARGDAAAAIVTAQELLALCEEQRLPQPRAAARLLLGWALTQSGEIASGILHLEEGLRVWQQLGARTHLARAFCLMAEGYIAGQRYAESRHQVELALAIATEVGDRWRVPMHLLRARLFVHEENVEAADAALRAGIALAQSQEAKGWQLRASTSLARLWRDHGKRVEARELLAPIYGWFTEGFDTPDLKEAKALLDELV